MSIYSPPLFRCTRFQYKGHNGAIWMTKDELFSLGRAFMAAYETVGLGWVGKLIDGPYDDATWTGILGPGGMGPYIVGKFPIIQAWLDSDFNTDPFVPPMDQNTPFSVENFNGALFKYVKVVDRPGLTSPGIVQV